MRTFTKTTKPELEEMRKLFQERWSLNRIARKFGKHHTSVGYWLKGYYGNQNSIPYARNFAAVKKVVVNKSKKKKAKLKSNPIEISNLCVQCQKSKSSKWFKTLYCGISCWDMLILKKNYY
jgi:IS30 family transposase